MESDAYDPGPNLFPFYDVFLANRFNFSYMTHSTTRKKEEHQTITFDEIVAQMPQGTVIFEVVATKKVYEN